MNFSFKLPNSFLEKKFNSEIWVIFGQGQGMILTFDIYLTSLTHLVE